MHRTIFPLLLLAGIWSQSISLLFSPNTPFNVPQMEFLTAWTSTLASVPVSTWEEVAAVETDVVVDYLYDEGLSTVARDLWGYQYYRMWGGAGLLYRDVFTSYLLGLNWSEVLLIGDTANAETVKRVYEDQEVYQGFSIVPSNADLSYALQFVGRRIKPSGINLLALFLSPRTCLHFLQALQAKRLNKPGYAFILSQEAARYRHLTNSTEDLMGNGLLIVAEEAETEPSLETMEARRLTKLLKQITHQIPSSPPVYSLYYTNQSSLVKACSSPSELSSSTTLLFPGNTSAWPGSGLVVLPTSVNYNLINPDLSLHPYSAQVERGFQVAFEEVNNRTDLLPRYRFVDRSVALTGIQFGYNFSLARTKTEVSSLGLIYMAPPVGQAVMGMTEVFKSLNVSIPITAVTMDSKLSNPETYPLYVRPRPSNTYVFSVTARLIRFFGWSQVAFLYSKDGGDAEDGYRQFLSVKDDYGINITNPEAMRALPQVLNSQTAAQVNASLSAIIESTTRIIIIAHVYIFVIADQLYDLGVREEYVQIYVGGYANSAFLGAENYKRRVVTKGSLQLYPSLFFGSVGRRVLQELLKRDGSEIFPGTCFAYDAAYLYFYATDYLLKRGLDYEDPYQIVQAMRETYFHGCSGFVKVEKGTNDRSASEIVINNFQYNHQNDTFEFKSVGSYNPLSIHPYQLTSALQWPDDGTTYADVKPNYLDCSFLQETVRNLPLGRVVGGLVCLFFCLYTVFLSALLWGRFTPIPLLQTKQPMYSEDVCFLGAVVCECLQFASQGPALTSLSPFLRSMCAMLSFSINAVLVDHDGVYWTLVNISLGLVCALGLIEVMGIVRLETKLPSTCADRLKLLMATVGYLLFSPTISPLLDIFLCYKGTSNELKDSFLNKDCSQNCWRYSHVGYVIGCSLALLLFLPITLIARPLWQSLHTDLHVKAMPRALLVKSALQVLLVTNTSLFQADLPNVHAYLYLSIMSVYIIWTCFQSQYNYDRLNLWHVLLTISLLSLSIAAHIASSYTADSLPFFCTLLGEWVILAAVGLALQKLVPRFCSFLKRERRKDVRGLFVFAFTAGRRAQEGLEHFYRNNTANLRSVVASEQDIRLEITSNR